MADNSQENVKFSGWTVTAAAFIIVVCHMMIRGSFATLIQGMVASTGWSTGVVSVGTSLFMVMYGLFAFFVGTYINKLGCRVTYTLHGIIMAVGLFLCSYAQEPWQYWVSYGIIAGIGSGAFWAPVTSMVRQWFIDKLGLAMGLTTAAAGVAMCLGPIVSMNLIAGFSWQFMMRVFAIILAVGIGIGAQFTIMKPEDAGQKPLGFDAFMAKQAAASTDAKPKSEYWVPFKWFVKTKYFWILAGLWFFSNFAEFIVFSHAVNYTTMDLGYDKRTATYIYCLIGLVFIFSAVGIGGFVDKLTAKIGDPMVARKRVLTVSYIGCAAMAAWLNYGVRLTAGDGTVVWAFVIYALLFGFFYGMYIPSVAGLVGLVTGRKEMPPAWGLISLIGMAGGAGLGPYIAGALRDATGSYFVAIWLSTAFYLVACLLTNMAKRPTAAETAEAQASVK